MIFPIAIVVYFLFLLVYWFFATAAWRHLKEYSLPNDYANWILYSFLGVMFFLSIGSIFLFFNLPFSNLPF